MQVKCGISLQRAFRFSPFYVQWSSGFWEDDFLFLPSHYHLPLTIDKEGALAVMDLHVVHPHTIL